MAAELVHPHLGADIEIDYDEIQVKEEAIDDNDLNGGWTAADCTLKGLLNRILVLEAQVATCIESQPLLQQVFRKCNILEQRFRAWRVTPRVPVPRRGRRQRLLRKNKSAPDTSEPSSTTLTTTAAVLAPIEL